MATGVQLLDQFGRPLTRSARSNKPLGDVVKIRRPEPLLGQSSLSIEALAVTMRQADEGDIRHQAELATEMEERDLHYFGQLSTRKNALVGRPVQAVAAAKDNAQAEDIAAAFTETVLQDDAFPGLICDLMDAMGKGFSIVQAIWDTTTKPWKFDGFEHIPQECFTYIPIQGDKTMQPLDDRLLHIVLMNGHYQPLAELPGLFLLHKPRLRTGAMPRGGFGRIAARNFLIKNFGVKEWLAFAEVYGIPLRYARYDPDTITEAERITTMVALANLGADASALVPNSVELEITDMARTGDGAGFDRLCRYLDEQFSKAILGQTMTADNGSSKAQAQVHDEVRLDYLRFDALQLQLTLRHLARAWTFVNYGPSAPVPRVRFAVDPPEDLTSWTTAVLPWAQAGLKVSKKQVLDKLDLSEPEGPEDEIEIEKPPVPGAPGEEDGAVKGQKPPKPAKAKQRTDALTGWDRLVQPHIDELESMARAAGSYEELLRRLQEGLSPSSPLIERLVSDALKARAEGGNDGGVD